MEESGLLPCVVESSGQVGTCVVADNGDRQCVELCVETKQPKPDSHDDDPPSYQRTCACDITRTYRWIEGRYWYREGGPSDHAHHGGLAIEQVNLNKRTVCGLSACEKIQVARNHYAYTGLCQSAWV